MTQKTESKRLIDEEGEKALLKVISGLNQIKKQITELQNRRKNINELREQLLEAHSNEDLTKIIEVSTMISNEFRKYGY